MGGDYGVWGVKGLVATYTQNDYNVWRTHFGHNRGSGAVSRSIHAFSEPASLGRSALRDCRLISALA